MSVLEYRQNPRWLQYCRAKGLDPHCEWTGMTGMEFSLWIQKHARDFTQKVCPGCTQNCGPTTHPDEWDAYLEEQADKEAACQTE